MLFAFIVFFFQIMLMYSNIESGFGNGNRIRISEIIRISSRIRIRIRIRIEIRIKKKEEIYLFGSSAHVMSRCQVLDIHNCLGFFFFDQAMSAKKNN